MDTDAHRLLRRNSKPPGQRLDSANHFLVGRQGDRLVIMNPPIGTLSPAEANNLAAWLVVIAGDEADFERQRKEIKKS